jgi:hypothetical protein
VQEGLWDKIIEVQSMEEFRKNKIREKKKKKKNVKEEDDKNKRKDKD